MLLLVAFYHAISFLRVLPVAVTGSPNLPVAFYDISLILHSAAALFRQ